MCREFTSSRGPVRQALAGLRDDGLIGAVKAAGLSCWTPCRHSRSTPFSRSPTGPS
ncbi:MAG TPA: hypothetical protein VFE39_05615 [Pseudonocardia sp.]|nr:hypothetical protein [Pseudonocardia sp.]